MSASVLGALRRDPQPLAPEAATSDDDAEVTLLVLQQLSYRRYDDVDPAWEEEPSLLVLRETLETGMETELRQRCRLAQVSAPALVPSAIEALLAEADGPSLSTWMEANGTLDHLREFVLHRAPYQLQEADPHSFAIPRLAAGVAKTALLELQMDEYGGHEPTEAHATLFGDTMTALGLEPVADVDRLPAVTLRTNTLLNRLGRSRRLVGASIGHLAVFEMTSVEPMARYAATVRRLLPSPAGTRGARFYDVHVAADGFHARVAADRLLAGFVDQHPDEAGELLFGASALLQVDADLTEHILRCWKAGQTSLRRPISGSALVGPEDRAHLALAS